jgi:hypothetical protein
MIAIVIGYTERAGRGNFQVLYAGRDAAAADAISLAPPVGIARTEMIKNPIVVRRRVFGGEPEAAVDPAPVERPAKKRKG